MSQIEHSAVTLRPLTSGTLADAGKLFAADRTVGACWCMWFIIRVKDYHEGAAAANRARFAELAATSPHPLGLLAIVDGAPAGWAAVGPRARYARAVRTPTMKSIDHADNGRVWLVPCFFIRQDMRGRGIARRLLLGAVDLAAEAGATAIEGFPTAGERRGSADQQVGTERLFESCGFDEIDRPSSNRVLMRRDLIV